MSGNGGNLTGNVNINTGQAQTNLDKLTKTAKQLIKTLQDMNSVATSSKFQTIGEDRAKSLSQTLGVYSKITAVAKAYASATKQVTDAQNKQTGSTNALLSAMKQSQKALEKVKKTKEDDFNAKSRTLTLYRQQAELMLVNAKAATEAARAKTILAKADQQAAAAAAKASGQPTAYQQQMAAMKQQAAATQQANKAQQQAQNQAQQAAAQQAAAQQKAANAADTAAQKMAAAQAKLAESERRLAANSGQNAAKFIADQQRKINSLQAEYSAAQQMVLVYQREAAAATQAARVANAKVQQTTPGSAANTAAMSGYASAANKAATANNNLAAAQNRATTAGRNLQIAETKLAATLEAEAKAAASVDAKYERLTSTRYALYEVGAGLTATTVALSSAMVASVKVAADYEQQFSDVARTTQLTGQDLASLKTQLIGITESLPVGFDEVTRIAALGAQLGISNDQVAEFTDTVAKFATVSNVSADDATSAFGRLENLLEVPTQDFGKLASAVAELGVNSVATESEILNVTQGIAASAHAAGLGTEYVLGLSTALASLRVPPEMARGAIQRILFIITKAMSEGGEAAQAYGKILGTTAQEAAALFKTNPEAFFSQMMEGIGNATDAGGDYVQILTDLGIKNARDIQVVQRLAGSYDVLAQSVQQANSSYNEGTFLDTAIGPKLDTLVAKFEIFMNTVKSFLNTIGGPFVDVLKTYILPVFTAIMSFLDRLAQTPVGRVVSTMVVAFLAFSAVLTGVKAAMALAGAQIAAFRQVASSGFATSILSVRGLKSELAALVAELRLATAAGQGLAGANAQIATSATAAAGATGRQAASAGAAAAANNAASGAGAATGAATGALSKFGKFASAGAKALPFIGTALVLLPTLIDLFKGSGSAAEQAAAQTAHWGEVLNNAAAGGTAGLANALKEDTKAFKESGKQISDTSDYVKVYKTHTEQLADGSLKVTTSVSQMGGAFKDVNTEIKPAPIDIYSQAITDAGTANDNTKTKVEGATQAYEDQYIAVGKATEAFQQQTLLSALTGPEFTAEDRAALVNAFPADELKALFAEVTSGSDAAIEHVIQRFDTLKSAAQSRLDATTQEWGDLENKLRQIETLGHDVSGATYTRDEIEAMKERRDELADTITDTKAYMAQIEHLAGLFTNLNGPIADAFNTMQIGSAAMGDVADETEKTDEQVKQLGTDAEETKVKIEDIANAFTTVVESAFGLQDATSGVYDAMQQLGQGLAKSLDMSALTEEGRQNLANVEAVVNAYGQVLAQGIENGQYTAQQAAQLMQDYMLGLVDQLANMGVPTDQLDYLVQYATAIVNTDWRMEVGADVSGAISGLDAVNDYAQATYDAIAQLGLNAAATQSGANIIEGARQQGYVPPTYVPNFSRPSYQGQTSFPGGTTGIDTSAIDAARNWQKAADAEQAAADAAKGAGSAAKEAGDDAADAADQASEAIQKQIEYLKDLGDYYANLASGSLQLAKNEGDVFTSLQELGNAVAKNGTAFNTFTEGGRENLEALTTVMDNFGETLSTQLQNGSISASEAATQYQQFAGGVRSELAKLGVPMSQIDAFFKGVGASSAGWKGASAAVSQYNGVLAGAAKYSKEFGDAAVAASEAASAALEKQKQYLEDVADAYANIGSSVMTFYNAQGAVFEALQNLGLSIQENGKHFNTVTEAGRANMAALGDAINAYGAQLGELVKAGIITPEQAAAKMKQYLGGLYQELRALGVPASEIQTIFKTLGYDASGWTKAGKDVKQYAGVMTKAEKAAAAAAAAQEKLNDQMAKAADYAERMGEAFDKAFEKQTGLTKARDATQSAINAMKNKYQEAIDKVKELAAANKQLDADIATATAAKNKLNWSAAIAAKYGETDRAADYRAQAGQEQQKIDEAKAQKKANDAEAKAAKKNATALTGNSDAAIANRASLLDLQSTMFDQIEAYAKTGASQKDVAKYAAEMKKQFLAAGKAAGYTSADMKKYGTSFDTYVKAIKAVPKDVKTNVTADTTAAQAAMNAIPDTKTYTVTAKAETEQAKKDLVAIPDKQNYTITPTLDQAAKNRAVGGIPKSGSYALSVAVSRNQALAQTAKIPKRGDYQVNTKTHRAGSGGTDTARSAIGRAVSGISAAVKVAVSQAQIRSTIQSALNAVNTTYSTILSILGLNVSGTTTTKDMTVKGTIGGGGGRPALIANQGGLITSTGVHRGFAEGGFVPGTPPSNPRTDNLLAIGPGGLMGLRSGEYVNPQPTVQYYGVDFFDALRERKISRTSARMAMSMAHGMAAGGSVGGGRGGSSNGMIVYLSPDDRALLRAVANRPVELYSGNDRIASSTAQGNRMLAARGGA